MTATRARWSLVLWGALGGLVLVAAYLVLVRHGLGQRLDFSAFEGRKWTLLWARRRGALAVRLLTPVTVVAVTFASTVVALRGRGVAAAVATSLSVPIAIVVARVLKTSLPRDELLSGSWVTSSNTYPSGHTASIVTVALMAVAVSPPRWRPTTSVAAVLGVCVHTVGMSGSGWHRPSDLVGGIGLGVLVAGWSALVVTWRGAGAREETPDEGVRSAWYRDPRSATAVVGLAAGAGLVWSIVLRLLGAASYGTFAVHLAALVSTLVIAGAVIVVHASLLDAADGARTDRRPELVGEGAADSAVR